tara:strand:+ start:991 stop:1332 length:342 start_codon:yes stop_codon:yes gene_type:complete
MTKTIENGAIQFVRGIDEKDYPEIRLFRDNDGKHGKVLYIFHKPKTITFENFKSIQKMYLIDAEGQLSTRKIDISIKENNIKQVKSTYNWHSEQEFDRFMRFAKRYANSLSNY